MTYLLLKRKTLVRVLTVMLPVLVLVASMQQYSDAAAAESGATNGKSSKVSSQEAQAILEKALRDFEQSQKKTLPKPEKEPLKKLSIPKVGASESPRNDGIHDHYNNALVTLQDPTRAMANFPRDRRHQVDWVAALEMGLIEPRADLKGERNMLTMDMDIIMKNTQYMPWVKFPHRQHTEWLACENCHPAIFLPREHANSISMNKVLRGKFCGVCHDKVAFAIFICERCHSVPHEGSGPKWW
ncbi:MAG: hypothetical protein OEZ68_01270 [Gammaproteobacteria bacterium]|nr:hypothetical protein [Gammaproteobacteria bacterium]MDH5799410.1 hypothetical protein [Gammaproteobacteria bacterium]